VIDQFNQGLWIESNGEFGDTNKLYV